jgi:hypothetical protein
VGLLIVARRDGVCRQKGVSTMVEHRHSKLAHERFCLEMQIPQHGVAMPSTHHTDSVVVDFFTHERHGAAGPEGAGADVAVVEPSLVDRGDGG